MNIFVEGLQGSGKSTAVDRIAEKHAGLKPVREGDYSPVELAWCAYVDESRCSEIMRKYSPIRRLIEEKTFAEGDRRVICYTQIKTDIHGFYGDLEQYEIYNGRRSFEEFRDIILTRFDRWKGDGSVFECSLFQNIVEDMILFRGMSDRKIAEFYRDICNVLKGKRFRIVYLETEDIAGNLEVIKKERCDESGNEAWFTMMCDYFNDSPYAKATGLSGFDGIVKHLSHRQALEMQLCNEFFPERTVFLRSKQYDESVL